MNPIRLTRLQSNAGRACAALNSAQRAWLGLAALLVAGAVFGWPLERERWDWQPALVAQQPWRLFSAIAVHYSLAHLAANVVGAALVAALGVSARVTLPMVWAWAAAWPITHLGLLADPGLAHYGGLSGVLHAGVAVAAWHLVRAGTGARRNIGAAVMIGLIVKVLSESPWAGAHPDATLGIVVAPLAHAAGLLAGLLCAAAAGLRRAR